MADAPAAKRHKASSDVPAASTLICGAITSSHSPAQQVLSGELLQELGQYLDVHSLLAAAATNSHFHRALTSEVAWHGSRWAPQQELLVAIAMTHQSHHLTFFSRLRHLVISTEVAIMDPMPALPALRSLDTMSPLSVADLQQMPQLQSLVLRNGWPEDLLPALSKTATLKTLHLKVSFFGGEELGHALALFNDDTTIHLECNDCSSEMMFEDLPPVLGALHYVHHACFAHVDICFIEHLAEECQELLEARPAHSKLRTLKLGLCVTMGQNMAFSEAVRHLLGMYPKLHELTLPDDIMVRGTEKEKIMAHCREHHVTLTIMSCRGFVVVDI